MIDQGKTTQGSSRLSSLLFRGRGSLDERGTCLRFTGCAPSTPSENLVKGIVGKRETVPLSWVKEQIADTLYDEERRKGGWVADIAIWGPTMYGREATRIIDGLRPEFCVIEGNNVADQRPRGYGGQRL